MPVAFDWTTENFNRNQKVSIAIETNMGKVFFFFFSTQFDTSFDYDDGCLKNGFRQARCRFHLFYKMLT